MKNITKKFISVKALNQVNFKVKCGEIHALCGENGAGKSTLMKVLSGVYPIGEYNGDIIFENEVCQFKSVNQSEALGIVIIHQELALIPHLSIAENIFLGNEQERNGVINWNETLRQAKKYLDIVGLDENPETLITNIGVGKQQLVEIAKAVAKNVKLLILDEPTAALNDDDSENLLKLLLAFKQQGVTSIIISHKLNEVTAVSDSITILRDGQTIETLSKTKGEVTEDRIIKGMVGRDMSQRYPEHEARIEDIMFEVKNWKVYHPIHKERKILDDINFHIKKGEIVGIAGLMGAGRTEFAMSIFGKSYGSKISGRLFKDGKELQINHVTDAIEAGLAYVSEDRKGNGLLLEETIVRNISLASLGKLSNNGIINEFQEAIEAEGYRTKLRIKTSSIWQKVGHLSGGNQQKVVLSKWMLSEPDILFLDEPTRGIDVGSKYEIYTIIQELAAMGKGICIISSELPEVLGMCHRIYAMNEGRITGEVLKEDATSEIMMGYMTRHIEGEIKNGN
jgi:putative multiple sugar transport system ATP-binding protein